MCAKFSPPIIYSSEMEKNNVLSIKMSLNWISIEMVFVEINILMHSIFGKVLGVYQIWAIESIEKRL